MNHQPSTCNSVKRDPQLGLFDARPADPNVCWLESLLSGAREWMTAKDIALVTQPSTINAQPRLSDRDIRALASASEWIISGQKGYLHLEHASAEDVAHAANWLISQGKLMIQRGCRIRKNAHRRIG